MFWIYLVADHTIIFRQQYQINSTESINWSLLEKELPKEKYTNTIRQLDVMINNLKKVIRTSKSSM